MSLARLLRPPLIAGLVLLLVGCGSEPLQQPLPSAEGEMDLSSPGIRSDGQITKEFTCLGAGKSPSLEWSAPPSDAQELAILVVDLDGPDGPLVHWSIWGIDPETPGLDAGVTPPEADEGETSFGRTSYEPICPPEGDTAHRYRFAIYALDDELDLPHGASPERALDEIETRALAEGTTEGEFAQ